MSGHDDETARLLAAEPGPSTVDVRRAIRSGRRTIRRRKALAPALAVLAVLAVVALSLSTATARHTQPAAAGQFAVLSQEFQVGSAAGFTPVSYQTGRYAQRIELVPDGHAELPGTTATVTMFASGRVPEPSGASADPVGAHRARWVGPAEIAWEWAQGSWGFAQVKGTLADRDKAYKVALSVTKSASVPVSVPFSASAAPGTRLQAVIFPYGSLPQPVRSTELRYGLAEGAGWIAVGLRVPPPAGTANDTIDGKPVSLTSTRIDYLDGSGLYVHCSDIQFLARIGGAGELRALAAAATVRAGYSWPPTTTTSRPS